jgi:putative inorganic carbon (hco3(-)) transporter
MLRSLLILAILVPGFFAALRNRYIALVMYLWFALFRPQDWIWIDITSLRLSMVFGIVLLVPALATGLFPNATHPLTIGMILFLCSSIVSQIDAVQPAIGWPWIDFLFRLFLACMMLVTLTSSSKRLVGVFAIIGGSLGFHAAKAGLAFIVGGGTRFADGLAGAFVDNNGYALGTVMIMPLLLATAQNIERLVPAEKVWIRKWLRLGFYMSVPLCMFAVIGTYSRGGFLSLSAALLVFIMLQRHRFAALASLAVVLALVLTVVPLPKEYTERLQTIQTYKEVGEDSALSRPHFWQVGINMGLAKTFGVGLRQYEAAYDQYDFLYGRFGRGRAVHSAHVQVFAEQGLFGALVWAGLFAWAFIACLRIRARSFNERLSPQDSKLLFTTANALIVSMTGFVVGGSFLALALNDITWLTFGMVAAVDRLSAGMCAEPVPELARVIRPPRSPELARVVRQPEIPLAFRAVESFRDVKAGRP